GTAGLPHVIVRFFTVPRVRDARISAGYALLFIAILYTTAPAIAAFARTNLITTVNNQPYESMPEWFDNWEQTGLLTYEDKNGDGLIQYYNDQNEEFISEANSYGWSGNELTIDKDIMVLANPEIARLPAWVIALVAAGGLAAALSTAAGLLLVISASISHDLLKKQLMPHLSDRQELLSARLAAAVSVGVAGYFGINPPDFVAAVVALAFGLAASSFFPAIVLGIFDRRMNMKGAVSGMIFGIALMLFYILKFKFGVFEGGMNAVPSLRSNWWLGISPEGFGTIAMLANLVVAVCVSRATAPPPDNIKVLVENIRIPRGAGAATKH
ncbi:MAG: VC_2705 family sodium/solute symporter, partial [Bacteroidota bacterium]